MEIKEFVLRLQQESLKDDEESFNNVLSFKKRIINAIHNKYIRHSKKISLIPFKNNSMCRFTNEVIILKIIIDDFCVINISPRKKSTMTIKVDDDFYCKSKHDNFFQNFNVSIEMTNQIFFLKNSAQQIEEIHKVGKSESKWSYSLRNRFEKKVINFNGEVFSSIEKHHFLKNKKTILTNTKDFVNVEYFTDGISDGFGVGEISHFSKHKISKLDFIDIQLFRTGECAKNIRYKNYKTTEINCHHRLYMICETLKSLIGKDYRNGNQMGVSEVMKSKDDIKKIIDVATIMYGS